MSTFLPMYASEFSGVFGVALVLDINLIFVICKNWPGIHFIVFYLFLSIFAYFTYRKSAFIGALGVVYTEQ